MIVAFIGGFYCIMNVYIRLRVYDFSVTLKGHPLVWSGLVSCLVLSGV